MEKSFIIIHKTEKIRRMFIIDRRLKYQRFVNSCKTFLMYYIITKQLNCKFKKFLNKHRTRHYKHI